MQLGLELILCWLNMVLYLGGVVEILRMLGLQLAFVRVGTRTEHVLWQGTRKVHLRFYEIFRFLHADLFRSN